MCNLYKGECTFAAILAPLDLVLPLLNCQGPQFCLGEGRVGNFQPQFDFLLKRIEELLELLGSTLFSDHGSIILPSDVVPKEAQTNFVSLTVVGEAFLSGS